MGRSPDTFDTTKLSLLCADLLTCTEALAAYAHRGLPEVHRGEPVPAPKPLLRGILDSVTPEDLPAGWGPLWGACAYLWAKRAASLEDGWGMCTGSAKEDAERVLRYARDHGTGIAFVAPRAARDLLRYSTAKETYQQASTEAARAAEEIATVLRGVV